MATPEDMRADAEHIRMADQFVEVCVDCWGGLSGVNAVHTGPAVGMLLAGCLAGWLAGWLAGCPLPCYRARSKQRFVKPPDPFSPSLSPLPLPPPSPLPSSLSRCPAARTPTTMPMCS